MIVAVALIVAVVGPLIVAVHVHGNAHVDVIDHGGVLVHVHERTTITGPATPTATATATITGI